MSTYETAPATILLATHCAACGRALVDAVSVETGMGPDCRAKHGYGDAQGAPSWEAAFNIMGADLYVSLVQPHFIANDARSAANKLVHLAACGKDVGVCIAAIDALGFKTLAAKLGDRIHAVRVEEVGGVLVVRAPFSPEFNEAVRSVPGQRFVKADKTRTVPVSSRGALWAALKKAFPAGTTVFGTKRAAVL